MKTAVVSERGQITLPASVRRELGIEPAMRLDVGVRNGAIVLRPMRSIADVRGSLAQYAVGKTTDWETIRETAMEIMAAEVAREGL